MNASVTVEQEFEVLCPHCGKTLLAPSSLVGRTADCLYCGYEFVIPNNSAVLDKRCCGIVASAEKQVNRRWLKWAIGGGFIVIAILGALYGIITIIDLQYQEDNVRNELPQRSIDASVEVNMFDRAKDKIVIINFDDGSSGTGFFVRMSDGVWLISNEHVLRGCAKSLPKIRMVSGEFETPIDEIEVAKDRDLARIKVKASGVPCFGLSRDTPNIGDDVCIYGNSDGGGVITEIKGNILGVSFDKIETDAKFVPGNSGSPMINKCGAVVGVATLLRNNIDKMDWTKKDTRFNDVRRYGERIIPDLNAWARIPYDEYALESAKSHDIVYYCLHLMPYLLIVMDGDVDEKWLDYTENNAGEYLYLDSGCHWRLMDVVKSYKEMVDALSVVHMRQKNRDREISNIMRQVNGRGEDASVVAKLYDFVSADKEAEFLLVNEVFLRNGITAIDFVEKICVSTSWQNPHILDELKGFMKMLGDMKQILLKRQGDVGDVYASAIAKIETAKSEYAVSQGTATLYRIALGGSLVAQRKFVEMWINRQLVDCIQILDKYWDTCIPWFLDSFASGNNRAALVLGDYEARRRRIKEARDYWKVSNTCMGWCNMARSYYQAGDEQSALKYYNLATADEFSDDEGYLLAKEGKALIYLYSVDSGNALVRDAISSYEKAAEIFRELLSHDPANAAYHYNLGVALIKAFDAMPSYWRGGWTYEQGEINARKGLEDHIKRAARMGYAPAISFLKDINAKQQ